MDIAQRIKYFMEIKRVPSVNELAIRSLLTQSTVQNIFSRPNQSPKVDTLEKICDGLGITMTEFFAPDLLPLVMAEYDKMDLDDEQKKDLAYLKDKSSSEQYILLSKALGKIRSLPPEMQKALFLIIDSLSASHP